MLTIQVSLQNQYQKQNTVSHVMNYNTCISAGDIQEYPGQRTKSP